jgi:hypothetical protein
VKTIIAPKRIEKTRIQKVAFDLVETLRGGGIVIIASESAYVAIADPASDDGIYFYFPFSWPGIRHQRAGLLRLRSQRPPMKETGWHQLSHLVCPNAPLEFGRLRTRIEPYLGEQHC